MRKPLDLGSARPPFGGSSANLMDSLLEGCQLIGPDWRYLYVNDAVAAQGRSAKEELLGRTMMEAYPGIDETPMFSLLRECMEDRAPRQMENEFTFPDGSMGWFELRFEPVPEGVFILSFDITERKRAEARVAHLNAVLRGIRNVNQLITRERDRDSLIRQACDLLVEARGFHAVSIGLTNGRSDEVLVSASAGQSLPALQGLMDRGEMPWCVREALTRRQIVTGRARKPCCEDCACTTSGDDGLDSLAIALYQDDRTYGFMVLFLPRGMGDDPEEQGLTSEVAGDLAFALRGIELDAEREQTRADLRSTEEQLRQAQKLEAVGQLAAGLAHDFNNILTVQLSHCDLILGGLRPQDPLSADVAGIKAHAERAAGLTRQLLAFSRKQALEPQVLDLNAVVADLEPMLRRLISEDIELVTALAEGLGSVKADPGQVEQAIMNLAVNARDAMPQGGTLTIETANVELDEGYAKAHVDAAAGPHVMLAITDTGTGMDADTQSRAFEPFFTTKEHGKGTGLGLATTYGIVKQSGGNIWLYSELGRGTSFKIYLPRVEAEPVARIRRETKAARGEGELVLVVEDEPALRDLFARMLPHLGYRVELAANGEEALAAVVEKGLRPDLLITDMVMPGMAGSALAERMGQAQPGLRILFTSGYTDQTFTRQGGLGPETAFLQKPFSVADLGAKIREVLSAGEGGEPDVG